MIYKATLFKAWGVRQLLGDGGRRRKPVQVLAQHHHGGGSLGLHLRGHPVGYVAARTDRSGSVPPHYCPSFKGLLSDLPWHPPCLTLPTIICSQSLGTLVMKRKSERGHLSVTLQEDLLLQRSSMQPKSLNAKKATKYKRQTRRN